MTWAGPGIIAAGRAHGLRRMRDGLPGECSGVDTESA